MAETSPPAATPPAQSAPAPAIDLAGLKADLASMLQTALESALKPLGEGLAKIQSAAPAAEAKVDSAVHKGALTIENVAKMLDDRLAAFSATQQTAQAREAFAAAKMSDLPAIYRGQLPQTSDLAALGAAERKIRSQYQADFKAAGGAPAANVSGNPPAGGSPPAAAVDVSKMTPNQKIEYGLSLERGQTRVGTQPGQGSVQAAG